MKKILALVGGGLIAGMLALASDAATVSVTGVTGTWASATPDNVTKIAGLNTNRIAWGEPASARGQSAYEFSGAGPLNGIAGGAEFGIGTFIHKNNPIFQRAITSATLKVAIHLLIGETVEVINATFEFNHFETPNKPGKMNGQRVCADGGTYGQGVNRSGCSDRVQVSLGATSATSFIVDDDQYNFFLSGFDGSFGDTDTIWTGEGSDNSASLLGKYTVKNLSVVPLSPVPLPATGFLMFFALAGLGALAGGRRSV